MDVRDAVEADAERLAELTGSPEDVMRNLVHDRTVRVAEADGNIRGFVSYDARDETVHVTQLETVHVTQLEGDDDAPGRLLGEPVRFARTEGMTVEVLVPEDESGTRAAAEEAGFERAGDGPAFEGQRTVRYRLDPR